MLTALGKVLRVIRIERGMLLKDMADMMGLKPSYISSIENGKRKPSEKFINGVNDALKLTDDEQASVKKAYVETIKEVFLRLNTPYQTELGLALARSFNDLTEDQAKAINNIIKKGTD